MTTTDTLIVTRPTPTRVPSFPKGGVPPLVYSILPPQLPLWVIEKIAGGPVKLDPTLRDVMIKGLWEGDPAMDKVVDWMFSVGAREGKQLFNQALDHGIDSVVAAPTELREFFAIVDQRPEWVDMSRVRMGARAMAVSGDVVHYLARDLVLMGGYLLAGFNEPLIMTGALSKGAGRRFAETMSWAMDIYAPDGMERFGVGFKSTLRVRMIHALVRRNLQRKPGWDFARLGLPINQTDMLATILSITTVAFAVRAMGVPVTNKEHEAVTHHGRYAAWLMGVKESWQFNSTAEGFKLLMHAASTHPFAEESSRIMAQSLAAEPLTRQYDYFQEPRRRFEHSRHLSISRLFLGKRTLEALGVPSNVLPWYPVLSIPVRFAWQTANRVTPGGYRRLVKQGRKRQLEMLAMFHAGANSAGGILQPDTHHPAHV